MFIFFQVKIICHKGNWNKFFGKDVCFMSKNYSRDFKKMIVELIYNQGHSTSKTAE